LSNHDVRVAKVEDAVSVEVATLHPEIAGLLGGVPGQEHIQLCPQLHQRGSLHGEEQIACVRAVPSEHFPSVVHTKHLKNNIAYAL